MRQGRWPVWHHFTSARCDTADVQHCVSIRGAEGLVTAWDCPPVFTPTLEPQCPHLQGEDVPKSQDRRCWCEEEMEGGPGSPRTWHCSPALRVLAESQ